MSCLLPTDEGTEDHTLDIYRTVLALTLSVMLSRTTGTSQAIIYKGVFKINWEDLYYRMGIQTFQFSKSCLNLHAA